jgi:hypothetical protein
MRKYFSLFIFLIALSHPELVSGSVKSLYSFGIENPKQSFNSSTHPWINYQFTFPRWSAASASTAYNQPFTPATFNPLTHQPHLKDSLKTKDTVYTHKWKTATIWSACLPGSGQIYNEIGYRRVANKKNRAWWKAPIIYGALGATGYFFYQNTITARALKAEWLFREANPGQLLYEEYYTWTNDDLLEGIVVPKLSKDGQQLYNFKNEPLSKKVPGFDLAAKRRDLLAFGFLAIWGLQVVEALVDGHFVHFDISQDLSFSWTPTMLDYSTMGVALRLDFD